MGLLGDIAQVFGSKDRTVEDCESMIEDLLMSIDSDIIDAREETHEAIGWTLSRGSAQVFIYLSKDEEAPTVRIVSPILYLPPDKLLPFYRRCLELNMKLLNCAIAAQENLIFIVNERPSYGLDEEELVGTLDYLSSVADELDDELAQEFGATRFTDRPQ